MSTVRLPGLLPTGTGRIPPSSFRLTRTQHSGRVDGENRELAGLLNPIVVRSFYKGNPRKIWTIKRPFTLLPPCRKSCVFSPVPPHSTPPIGWSIGELA